MTAFFALLLRHRAAVVWLLLTLAAAGATGWAFHRLDRGPLERARAQAAAAQAQAEAAQAQARLDTSAAQAVEAARTVETHAVARSGAAADAIAHLPHAQDPLDGDVLAQWASAVDGLRDEARVARRAAIAPGGGGAARALPAP